jgi:hypothetical protein
MTRENGPPRQIPKLPRLSDRFLRLSIDSFRHRQRIAVHIETGMACQLEGSVLCSGAGASSTLHTYRSLSRGAPFRLQLVEAVWRGHCVGHGPSGLRHRHARQARTAARKQAIGAAYWPGETPSGAQDG